MPPQPQGRHARQRARPAAAAANQAAVQAARAQRQRAPRPARQPAPPPTLRQQRQKAIQQGRQQAVRRIARSTVVTPEGAAAYAVGRAGQAGRDVGRARIPTGNRRYQGVVLAEFIAAVLIVAVAPLARGGGPIPPSDTQGGSLGQIGGEINQGVQGALGAAGTGTPGGPGSGPSPYGPDDLKQLVAIGMVYFVLALLSSGNSGRLAAWLGGLILIAIGLAETGSGALQAAFSVFQPSAVKAGSTDATTQAA